MSGTMVGPLGVGVAELILPRLCTQGHHAEVWHNQKYRTFAEQVERKNSGVTFTKDLMDLAFQTAVSRLSMTTLGGHGDAKAGMISRVSVSSSI